MNALWVFPATCWLLPALKACPVFPQEPGRDHLSYAMTYLPLARSGAVLPYYRTLNATIADNSTAVVAMDLGQ